MGEKKKELVLRYGAYWKRRDGEPLPHCPACKNLLSYRKEECDEYGDVLFYTEAFCKTCKKVSPVHDDEGYDITIKDAIGLMKAKFHVEPEQGESEEETRAIGNGIIIGKVTDILAEVDAIKKRLDSMSIDIRDNKNLLLSGIGCRITELSKVLVENQKVINGEIVDAFRAVHGIGNSLRLAKDDIQGDITRGNLRLLREMDNIMEEYKALYPPKNIVWQKIVGFCGLITFSFIWSIVITFAIMRLFE